MSEFAGAAIAAGAALLGTGAQMVQTGKLNKKNRQWQEDMWNKTNAYNHPSMQMARFKEAGLNPHLIYGQGNSGNATMAAAPEQKETNFSGFSEAAMNYVAVRKQQQEINNMKKVAELTEAQKSNQESQTVLNLSNSAKTEQDRIQAAQLFQTKVRQVEADLNNTTILGTKMEAEISKIGTDQKLSQKQIQQITQSIEESKARIINYKYDNNNKAIEGEFKRIQTEIYRRGGNPNDPAWQRLLIEMLDTSGVLPALKKKENLNIPIEAGKKVGNFFKDFIDWNWGTGKRPW